MRLTTIWDTLGRHMGHSGTSRNPSVLSSYKFHSTAVVIPRRELAIRSAHLLQTHGLTLEHGRLCPPPSLSLRGCLPGLQSRRRPRCTSRGACPSSSCCSGCTTLRRLCRRLPTRRDWPSSSLCSDCMSFDSLDVILLAHNYYSFVSRASTSCEPSRGFSSLSTRDLIGMVAQHSLVLVDRRPVGQGLRVDHPLCQRPGDDQVAIQRGWHQAYGRRVRLERRPDECGCRPGHDCKQPRQLR